MNDWIDRLVRMKRQLVNGHGEVFMAGEVVRVTGHYRGRLSLQRPSKSSSLMDGISRIPRHDVELLPTDLALASTEILEGALAVIAALGQKAFVKNTNGHLQPIEMTDVEIAPAAECEA